MSAIISTSSANECQVVLAARNVSCARAQQRGRWWMGCFLELHPRVAIRVCVWVWLLAHACACALWLVSLWGIFYIMHIHVFMFPCVYMFNAVHIFIKVTCTCALPFLFSWMCDAKMPTSFFVFGACVRFIDYFGLVERLPTQYTPT